MRVMVLVKATEDSEKGFLPTAWASEMLVAIGRFNDELREADLLLATQGLQPSSPSRSRSRITLPLHPGYKRMPSLCFSMQFNSTLQDRAEAIAGLPLCPICISVAVRQEAGARPSSLT